jgi:hypothetical protein
MKGCALGDDGIRLIAEDALVGNTVMELLNIRSNYILLLRRLTISANDRVDVAAQDDELFGKAEYECLNGYNDATRHLTTVLRQKYNQT